jgi:hypothetical protein
VPKTVLEKGWVSDTVPKTGQTTGWISVTVPQTVQATGWISGYSAKNDAENRMDFSLECQKRCKQQDGFKSRVPKTGQAIGRISV